MQQSELSASVTFIRLDHLRYSQKVKANLRNMMVVQTRLLRLLQSAAIKIMTTKTYP